MGNEKLLSIVVPVYNGEKYLRQTINSILQSDYQNLEVILVNDGSDDGSPLICQKIEKDNKRVKYISQENKGIVSARNRGIKEATGEFICFCDQDDLVSPIMYSRMINRLEKDESELCLCGTCKFYEDEKEIYEKFEDAVYKDEEVRKKLLHSLLYANLIPDAKRIQINSSIWKCVIRKNVILDNQMEFRKFVDYEDDWIFLTELLIYCNSVSTVNIQGYYWRTNLNSESHARKYVSNIAAKQRKLLQYIQDVLKKKMSNDELNDFTLAKRCFDIIKFYENESCYTSSPFSIKRKILYIRKTISDLYSEGVGEKSKNFTKGCIRYKVIYFFVNRKLYIMGYVSNFLLQTTIRVLHRLRVGNKIEAFIKK